MDLKELENEVGYAAIVLWRKLFNRMGTLVLSIKIYMLSVVVYATFLNSFVFRKMSSLL